MRKMRNIIIGFVTYCVVLVSVTPVTHAEQTQQKVKVSNNVAIMQIYDIILTKDNGDLIIFKDKTGEMWGAYGDLMDKYKGQYALVVLQSAKGISYKDKKVIDFILKEDIKYLKVDRIKDILML